ncbi:hypothetical protein DKX38_014312 [Salix brachista]|uniref:Chromo domain-containing protein n=1 Tax=Salix brachista TaxID=2182728 RepID=A0A5N5LFS0_9ROSI|nr:hypothetical protein DKX38_014312 [Salix brachista]
MGDSSNTLQDQFETFMKMYQEHRQHDRIDREQLSARIEELSRDLSATRTDTHQGDDGSANRNPRDFHYGGHRQDGRVNLPRYSRLEFPLYDGKQDPLAWLSRCEHFFRHQHIPEAEKVEIASYHLDEDAQVWFLKLDRDRPGISWEEFKRQCHLRFGPSIQGNKLGALSKLRQVTTVEDYQRQFEQLAARAGPLTSEQELEIFISGLQEYIAIEVELHRPQDLTSAMSLARLYERRGGVRKLAPTNHRFTPQQPVTSNSNNSKIFKRLSRTEMDERRAKGLCFNCDEVYTRGHQCKRLFWLDGIEESVQGETEDHDIEEEFPPEISLHAIMGEHSGGKTMKIHGIIGNQHLLILIDSGSTHSFLGSQWVTTLGLTCEPKAGLQVMVANGNKIRSPGQCLHVPVMMGNQLIQIDFYVLQLTGIDAVLGVNWLQTLGPILWDFKAKTMVFKQHGRVMELQGADNENLRTPVLLTVAELAPTETDLDLLLSEFEVVFQEPKGLPPVRTFDHRINLEPGTHPVVVRPYRYPHAQKDEIERQCIEMLERGDSFQWTHEAALAFEQLKKAMTCTPVLALPDFTTNFILECDASDSGLGAVLQQQGKPIAYFSRPLASRYRSLPAYEKELIGLAKAVRHWRAYLWGRPFLIRTDHYSLKFLLDQRIITSPQQHWLSKLMGFDFSVEYRAGRQNTVADALSRCLEDQASLSAISMPLIPLFDSIRMDIQTSEQFQLLLRRIQQGEAVGPWEYKDGLIFFKGRVYLQDTSPLVQSIIAAIHDGGHEGYQKTLHREIQPLPKAILDSRVFHNKKQVLVHWNGLSPADSSWEEVSSFQSRFPSFTLADKCQFNGGSDVMTKGHVDNKLDKGFKVYQRRGRAGDSRAGDVEKNRED